MTYKCGGTSQEDYNISTSKYTFIFYNLNNVLLLIQKFPQEIAFFDVSRTGELLSRLSEDTQIIKSAATTNLSEALRNVTTAIIGIGFMFSSSWKLTC